MKINNKDVIQSYILTTAKYDFSVYEKRILYRLVEMVQCQIEGKKLDRNFRIEQTLYDDKVITMPVSAFLVDETDENYSRIKKALRDLRNKTFEYDDGNLWKLIGIIEKPDFTRSGYVRFEVQAEVYNAILNFSKGFRKYELKTAMSFASIYAMRFYELLSGQKEPITYTIDHLKLMFKLETKYRRTNDFVRKVIIPAKKELDAESPFSFDYKMIKDGKMFCAITFSPVTRPENRDPQLEKQELQKQIFISWDLTRMIRNYLRENFFFSDTELRHNIELFKEAAKELDLMYKLSEIKPRANRAANPKGYVINALKKSLQQAKNKQ
ncbi:DNA replication protein [Bacteroidales bacterium Barb6]|nr:DNA replication protein [Bacteroidales bacterium Barb6]